MAKKGRGQSKGSSFERLICKQLSLWWTDNERDDIFWRTAGSGARATTRARKGKDSTAGAYGDLTFLDTIGKPLLDLVCFELKRGYKWDLLDLLDKRAGTKISMIESFWQQAQDSSNQAKVPYSAVIFKRDSRQACILINKAFVKHCNCVVPKSMQRITCKFNKTYAILMRLDDFLNVIKPNLIK